MPEPAVNTSRRARRNRRRRARAAITKHGHTPDPIFWPCPDCLASTRQRCRPSVAPLPDGRNYHDARTAAANYRGR